MTDQRTGANRANSDGESLRDRVARQRGESFGKLIDDLGSAGVIGDALSQVVKTGERAVRAQEAAMSALRLPTSSDVDRLAVRLRTVFRRLEEIEDLLDELDQRVGALETRAAAAPGVTARPTVKLKPVVPRAAAKPAPAKKPKAKPTSRKA